MSVLDDLVRVHDRAPRVAVIGDYLLDGWWTGRIDRVAREAPAPVVDVLDRRYAPGGAANTAVNLAALGARVVAVGLVGDDPAGGTLRGLLASAGVDVRALRTVPGARTTTKDRVVAADQLVLRLDDTERTAWPVDAVQAFVRTAADVSVRCDAEVLCDYGSTLMTEEAVGALADRPGRAPLSVVDAHDVRRWSALQPDLVTPNAAEAEAVLDAPLPQDVDRAAVVAGHTDELLDRTGARAAVVTLDRDGSVLVRRGTAPRRTHAHPALEKQASGAGDTFVAALTAAAASGVHLDAAVTLAQCAADVAVQKAGTCVCSFEELVRWLGGAPDPTLDVDELEARLAEHRRQGHRIVFTNGCFDVLHRGHTAYLRQARELGDVLVVAINADASVRRLKGPDRPINTAADRASVLAALSCVDHVVVFAEDTPRDLIRRLRPDIYAKGGDYTPQMLAEADVVAEVGGEVRILDYVPAHSTSAIVGRIRSTARAFGGGA